MTASSENMKNQGNFPVYFSAGSLVDNGVNARIFFKTLQANTSGAG
jgi:hypothetical protein